ncbi:hypothetical protein QVD17_17184 [Tagetes erecta]|uniref:Gnk2-homologous domain-containing protein n=1 Tax=Tagetes erecta TaxID=13708 RepID=A0AAD8KW86_TARER|nr:hypothetical protein QVD17_17184 [Tagetes erecta]
MFLNNFLIKAQPQYPFIICHNESTYTPNSTYSINLAAALSSLPDTNSGYGFFNSSTGQVIDTANAACLCRADVQPDICETCLRDSIYHLRRSCPNQREAVIYYEFCLLKYSDGSILGDNDMQRDFYPALRNANSFPDKNKSNDLLQPFMSKLRVETAAGGSLLKFARDNTTGPENTTFYGLMQCIPALSEAQCNDCLEYAINRMSTCCDGRVGVILHMARCNARFEIYDFFGNQSILPAPSRPPRHVPPPPGGMYLCIL